VDFGKPLYLSKFYEKIEDIDGVEYVTITEFRKEADAPGSIEPDGKIELGVNEIPKAPDDPVSDQDYLLGVKLTSSGGV